MGRHKTTAIERTAYHEAGHAVMAWNLGRGFRHVTIEPDGDSLGHIMYQRFTKWFDPESDNSLRVSNVIETCIKTALAGPIAEKLFCGRWNHVGAGSDYRMASDMALYSCGNLKVVDAYMKFLQVSVTESLGSRFSWPFVDAVAKSLLDHRRLTAAKVRAIMQRPLPRNASSAPWLNSGVSE